MGEAEEFLSIGKITGPQGIKGEVRMAVLTGFPEDIVGGRKVYLTMDKEQRQQYSITSARFAKGMILKFAGIDDRNSAESLKGALVEIPISEAHELDADEYWHFELLGCAVVTEDGRDLGKLEDIIETGSNDVYVAIDEDGRASLIPALKDIIIDIDIAKRVITIRPIPGLLEE